MYIYCFRDRQTDRHRHRDTHRDTHRDRETHTARDRVKETKRNRDRDREREERERERERESVYNNYILVEKILSVSGNIRTSPNHGCGDISLLDVVLLK